jgi:hypothetical protein
MTVDDVVEAIFRRLCLRQRHQGAGAAMSLTELRIGLGVTEEQLAEAVKVARTSDDLFVAFTAPDRLTLGPFVAGSVRGPGAADPMSAFGGPGAGGPATGDGDGAVMIAVLGGLLTIAGVLWGVYGLMGLTLGLYAGITGYPQHGLPAFGPAISGAVIFAMGAAAAWGGRRLRRVSSRPRSG